MFEPSLLRTPCFEFKAMNKMFDHLLACGIMKSTNSNSIPRTSTYHHIIKQIDPTWGIDYDLIDLVWGMDSIMEEVYLFLDFKSQLIRETKNYDYPLFTAFASSLYDPNPPSFLVEKDVTDGVYTMLCCLDGKLHKKVVSSFYFRQSDAVKTLKPIVRTEKKHNTDFAKALSSYIHLRAKMTNKFETIDGKKYVIFDMLNSLFPMVNQINEDGSFSNIDASLFFNYIKETFPTLNPCDTIKENL